MKTEDCVVFETDRHWVERTDKGFKIWETGPTVSTLAATIGYTGEKGLAKCKAEISRREGGTVETKKTPAKERYWTMCQTCHGGAIRKFPTKKAAGRDITDRRYCGHEIVTIDTWEGK